MSSSKSQQQQQQTFTDNRAVLGQDANYANNGSSINNYTLDGEVVNRSLDTVDSSVDKALTFAGNAQANVLDLAAGSVSTVASFGGRVLDQVAGTEQLVANAYNDAKGQGALTQKILIVAVAGALLIAFVAVKKKD